MPRRRKFVKRQNKKVVRKVKKLAKVRNKKIVRKPRTISKVKRVVKKRYKAPSNKRVAKKAVRLTKKVINQLIKDTSSFEIEGATTRQLKKYIEDSVRLINASYKTMNRSSKLAYKQAMRLMGEDNGGLSFDTKGDKKLDLVEKARVLESLQDGDGVSEVSLIRKNMKMLKQFKGFKKSATGVNLEGLNFEDYNFMVKQAGRIEKIFGDYYNTNMFDYLHEYKDTLGMETVGKVMIDTYKLHMYGINPETGKRIRGWEKDKGLDTNKLDKYIKL